MVSKRVRILSDELREFTGTQTRRFARALAEELVVKTPKATTWAASRWRMSLTDPGDRTTRKPGKKAISAAVSSSFQEQRSSFQSISRLRRKNQGTIWINNDAQYINLLNAGSSTQAPAKFVESAFERILFKARVSRTGL